MHCHAKKDPLLHQIFITSKYYVKLKFVKLVSAIIILSKTVANNENFKKNNFTIILILT